MLSPSSPLSSSVPEVVLLGHEDPEPAGALQHLAPPVVAAEPLVEGDVHGEGVEGPLGGVPPAAARHPPRHPPRLLVVEEGDGVAGRHLYHADVRGRGGVGGRVRAFKGGRADEEGHRRPVVQPRRPAALVLAQQDP